MLRAMMAGWVPAVGPARVRACLDPGLTITEGPVNYRSLRQTVRENGRVEGVGEMEGRRRLGAWGELQAGVGWWPWEHEKDTDGAAGGPVLRDACGASAGSASAWSRQCYLLAWDPWSSGWADLPRKTRGPLGKERETRGRTLQLGRDGLSPGRCMWRLIISKHFISSWNTVFFFLQRK